MVTSKNLQKLAFFRTFWLIFGQNFTFIWPGHGCSSCMPNSKFHPSSHGSHPMLNNLNWYSSLNTRNHSEITQKSLRNHSEITRNHSEITRKSQEFIKSGLLKFL